MKTRSHVELTTMGDGTMADITAMKLFVTEVSAVRDEGVMVKECTTAMPVVSPVAPTPSKSSKESDSKSDTERESGAAPKNSRHRIPVWVSEHRRAVHQPGIIGGHVDHFRVGRLDDDRAALR